MSETCYVCQETILESVPIYRLVDDEGLEFLAHKQCVETDMEAVTDPNGTAATTTK